MGHFSDPSAILPQDDRALRVRQDYSGRLHPRAVLSEDEMKRCAGLVMLVCAGLAACGREDAVTRGAALYAEHCAICHGADLRGGGGVGVVGLGRTPSDLTILSWEAGGAFPRAEVLAILDSYAEGRQTGRIMRPFVHLTSEETRRVRTRAGRRTVPEPQAALLAYLEASQRP
jgi:cytochrome c553